MELVIRFLVGGLVVSMFAAAGELFKPKTFSGLFGAAPSVALASLGLAFHTYGPSYVRLQAMTMIGGAIALLVYSHACAATARREHVPVWLGAGLAWFVWGAVALVAFEVLA